MYFSLSNEFIQTNNDTLLYFRVTFIDGRTYLFNTYDEAIKYVNDARYAYLKIA